MITAAIETQSKLGMKKTRDKEKGMSMGRTPQ